ncbi:histidine kinase [Streptomyces sp. NPDC127117]
MARELHDVVAHHMSVMRRPRSAFRPAFHPEREIPEQGCRMGICDK